MYKKKIKKIDCSHFESWLNNRYNLVSYSFSKLGQLCIFFHLSLKKISHSLLFLGRIEPGINKMKICHRMQWIWVSSMWRFSYLHFAFPELTWNVALHRFFKMADGVNAKSQCLIVNHLFYFSCLEKRSELG